MNLNFEEDCLPLLEKNKYSSLISDKGTFLISNLNFAMFNFQLLKNKPKIFSNLDANVIVTVTH